MDEITVLGHLEALAFSLGVETRYERLENETGFSAGGLCRFKGKSYIIVNSAATLAERIQIFIRALKRFDLDGVYVRPILRELLERPDI